MFPWGDTKDAPNSGTCGADLFRWRSPQTHQVLVRWNAQKITQIGSVLPTCEDPCWGTAALPSSTDHRSYHSPQQGRRRRGRRIRGLKPTVPSLPVCVVGNQEKNTVNNQMKRGIYRGSQSTEEGRPLPSLTANLED